VYFFAVCDDGALVRALDTLNAERRWLTGEDIFAGLLSEPTDAFDNPGVARLFERTFTPTQGSPSSDTRH
jgi:hypothetical protein